MSFCTIKYCEYDNFIAQTFTWSAKDKVDANINENKEILVNPLCYAQLLIEYIYEFAKFDAQGLILPRTLKKIILLFYF